MYCIGLKDNYKNIDLHSFSQPIPLPIGCINASYDQLIQNERGECIGYNIAINELVSRHITYEKDWCSSLTGMCSAIVTSHYTWYFHDGNIC